MEHFEAILRACRQLAKNPGLDIDYSNADFSIKIRSGSARHGVEDTAVEQVKLSKPLVSETAHVAEYVTLTSTHIGHFIRSVNTEFDKPIQPREWVKYGQIIGFCAFGVFCVPVRSTASGWFERYLIEDGEMMEFGKDLAHLSPGE